MLTSAVLRMVGFCTRHPWPVIVIAAMLAIGSAFYTAAHFAITTDTDQLLPKDLPWRQHEQVYRNAFPQDQIARTAVVRLLPDWSAKSSLFGLLVRILCCRPQT